MTIVVPNTLAQYEDMILSTNIPQPWKVPDYRADIYMFKGNMIHKNGRLYRCLENCRGKNPEDYIDEFWYDWGAWDNINGQIYNGEAYTSGALVTHSSAYKHFIYKASVDVEAGVTPSINPTKWKNIGAINLYRNLYGKTENKTEVDGGFYIEYASNRADYISLIGINAQSIDIEVKNSSDSILIPSKNIQLIRKGATNWKEFWFKDFSYKTTFGMKLPLGFNNKIKVTLNSSGIARLGSVSLGRTFFVGKTLWNAGAGILDFSKITRDEQFGDLDVKQGSFAKRMNAIIIVDTNRADSVFDFLTSIRGKEVVFIGDSNDAGFDMLKIRGISGGWEVTLSNPTTTEISLQVKGFI